MLELFNAPLTGAFQPTKPFLITGSKVVLDFEFDIAGTVEWYKEFASEDPNAASTIWHREVAEEDVGGGITNMPPVVRNFVLTTGNLNRDCEFVRTHQFCRVQIRVTSVAPLPRAIVRTPFGDPAQSP